MYNYIHKPSGNDFHRKCEEPNMAPKCGDIFGKVAGLEEELKEKAVVVAEKVGLWGRWTDMAWRNMGVYRRW